MVRATTANELRDAFQQHLKETQGQIQRLDQLIEATDGVRLKRVKCQAMEGLVKEAQEIIESVEAGPVRDAGLIGAGLKVEHYEIATYDTLHALALKLGYKEAAALLAETLQEEKSTGEKLTVIAGKQ